MPQPSELPWAEEEFDGFIVILDPQHLDGELARKLALGLVQMKTDWIETTGRGAESLHDVIDGMSVEIGRQSRVGDGTPMTAWHEDLTDLNGVIDYVKLGGLGASDNKLVIIIGGGVAPSAFADRLL